MVQGGAFAALLVLSLSAGARAEEAAPPAPAAGQVSDGVALEISIKSTLELVGSGSGSSSSSVLLGQPVGKLFVGRKVGRLVVGAGLELARVGVSASSSSSAFSSSSSQMQILFSPGLRWSFATSADQRVEALWAVNLGIGHIFTDSSSSSSSTPGNYRVVYEVGPGLRYWLHPQFALGANAGLRGDLQFFDNNGSSTTYSLTSIFTGLDVLGVF